MTDSEIAENLTNVLNEVRDYTSQLNSLPKDQLPSDFDAVCLAEWTDNLATLSACCPSVAHFMGSFWETHHMLAEHVPYETAVRNWFAWAESCLETQIQNHSDSI